MGCSPFAVYSLFMRYIIKKAVIDNTTVSPSIRVHCLLFSFMTVTSLSVFASCISDHQHCYHCCRRQDCHCKRILLIIYFPTSYAEYSPVSSVSTIRRSCFLSKNVFSFLPRESVIFDSFRISVGKHLFYRYHDPAPRNIRDLLSAFIDLYFI